MAGDFPPGKQKAAGILDVFLFFHAAGLEYPVRRRSTPVNTGSDSLKAASAAFPAKRGES